jgi:hypothetical protein
VAAVDVENEKAMAAIFEIVANSRLGNVKETPLRRRSAGVFLLGYRTLRETRGSQINQEQCPEGTGDLWCN